METHHGKVYPVKPSRYFRSLIERSSMSNNEEYVCHGIKQITFDGFKESDLCKQMGGGFHNPHLVFSRPVYEEEIENGLNVNGGLLLKECEECPSITQIMDGLYKLKVCLDSWMEIYEKPDPTRILCNIIAQHYYDCMSGGMAHSVIVMCRMMVRQLGCDLTAQVYPKDENEWHSLGDWMEVTRDINEKEIGIKLLQLGWIK